MNDIHIIWQSRDKPISRDLTILLSVRQYVVERALLWLRRNNPLYIGIEIDMEKMDNWGASVYGMPQQLYNHLER